MVSQLRSQCCFLYGTSKSLPSSRITCRDAPVLACASALSARQASHANAETSAAAEQSTNASPASIKSVDHAVQRRSIMLGTLLSGAAVLFPPTSYAVDDTTVPQQKLPKAYVEVVNRVIMSLRESIEAEQKAGKESEVRRKADPAKESLQVFVKRWRDDPKVQQHPSHGDIKGVLLELSRFYQTAGPRARMPNDVQERLLGLLASAESSLAASAATKASTKKTDSSSNGLHSTLSLFDESRELEELLPRTRE